MTERDEKKAIRKRMRALRASMDIASYRKKCMAIAGRCAELPEFMRARTVHIYVSSLNNEVDTLGLIYRMFGEGKRVVVPVCGDEPRSLRHIRIGSLDELRPGTLDIMEPDPNRGQEVTANEIDLVIIPLLAFDRAGGRLGFGGGYYDTFLDGCTCPKIGLAYSFQEVPEVPREPHDRTLDIIVTEKEIVRIG